MAAKRSRAAATKRAAWEGTSRRRRRDAAQPRVERSISTEALRDVGFSAVEIDVDAPARSPRVTAATGAGAANAIGLKAGELRDVGATPPTELRARRRGPSALKAAELTTAARDEERPTAKDRPSVRLLGGRGEDERYCGARAARARRARAALDAQRLDESAGPRRELRGSAARCRELHAAAERRAPPLLASRRRRQSSRRKPPPNGLTSADASPPMKSLKMSLGGFSAVARRAVCVKLNPPPPRAPPGGAAGEVASVEVLKQAEYDARRRARPSSPRRS